MSNLRRRLLKLEAQLTDGSGQVPHSPAWMDYRMREVDKVIADKSAGPKRHVPLEALRAWMQAQPDSE